MDILRCGDERYLPNKPSISWVYSQCYFTLHQFRNSGVVICVQKRMLCNDCTSRRLVPGRSHRLSNASEISSSSTYNFSCSDVVSMKRSCLLVTKIDGNRYFEPWTCMVFTLMAFSRHHEWIRSIDGSLGSEGWKSIPVPTRASLFKGG